MRRRYKIPSADYTEAMLPQTRKEVFFDVLKLHWFDLLKLGGLLALAALPSVVLALMNDLYELRLTAQTGARTDEILAAVAAFRNTSAWLDIPCGLLFGLVFSGVLRLLRQYSYEEVPFFWRDIGRGIRQNCRQILLISLLFGFQRAVTRYLFSGGTLAQSRLPALLGTIFAALTIFVFLPVWAYMAVAVAVYDNSFAQNFRLSFAVYAKNLGRTLLVLPAVGVLALLALAPNLICHIAGRLFGALLCPLTALIWMLFTLDRFDRDINPIYFPEQVGRGLYRENKEK